MRASKLLSPTLREVPAEAEVISHKLLLRAGFIRKSAAGVYTYLPLAQRVLKKISEIVREEMEAEDGQEIILPIIQPAELWQESGRWNVYGDELFRLKDRHGRDFALGPTHEEIITDLVRGEVRSYKQLPLLLYQIQNKYRDERRPRFGLMRGREFIMKDLYSFDKNEEGLDLSYHKMYNAYTRVFSRCGLDFRPVEADSGAIGGSDTHEFMVMADSGEAAIVYCEECDYAANVEKAQSYFIDAESGLEEQENLEEVITPDVKTIAQLVEFIGQPATKMIKTLLYKADDQLVVFLVPGDREINEIKVQNMLGCLSLELASEHEIEQATGSKTGFVGPVNLTGIRVIADREIKNIRNGVAGANKLDTHYKNVNPGRDFSITEEADISTVRQGDPCPKCKAKLTEARGIEVGQVFKLGTKYSTVLGAKFLDENGKEKPLIMGCYGIGVSRTMAAAIEQNHDEDGIIWPMAIAPFQVSVVPVSNKDEQQVEVAEQIYGQLRQAGIEVLIDDRNERPGVKFKDADLIGYPIRITVGSKTLAENKVEIKARRNGNTILVNITEVVANVAQMIKDEI